MGLLFASVLFAPAHAQSGVPDRQVPPAVLAEVGLLENRFEIALSADCDETRCFSKGCVYVDHAVADRPRNRSLPGLGQDPGPGSVVAQEYLTRARCSFAYEENVEKEDVQALARRLQNKLSSGWTVVSVTTQRLQPIPPYLKSPPEPEVEEDLVEPEPEPEPAPTSWSRELWESLLPHFSWMIAVLLGTLAGTILIWAWRRVGRDSIEDQMLLAELARGDTEPPAPDEAPPEDTFVADQDAAWSARLAAMDPEAPDPELQALARELLRSRDLPLLAKTMLRFPDTFPAAFPAGGEVATAKLELSEYLKDVDTDALPDDTTFFRALNRHALSAAVASQSDASIVRSLREEFGATGLAAMIDQLPPRPAALLFALAPADAQHELVRLLEPGDTAAMANSLLQSNRMSPSETQHLFQVLTAARDDRPIPQPPPDATVTDRGEAFDAVGALSVLLESVNPARRASLFGSALDRAHGSLPAWHREILVSDMLLELDTEARADLLLGIENEPLAAWLSLLDRDTRGRVLDGMPSALRAAVGSAGVFPSRSRQLALAAQGRRNLVRGFQEALARRGVSFESIVGPREVPES